MQTDEYKELHRGKVQLFHQENPGFLTRWVEVLRSGRYQQTRSVLRRDLPEHDDEGGVLTPVGFCCLGVGLDVIDPGAWEDDGEGTPSWYDDDHVYQAGDTENLPFVSDEMASTLARMNDGFGAEMAKGFDGIADYVERYADLIRDGISPDEAEGS